MGIGAPDSCSALVVIMFSTHFIVGVQGIEPSFCLSLIQSHGAQGLVCAYTGDKTLSSGWDSWDSAISAPPV